MRAIWTGAISFGLVNIPVSLYSAVESQGGLSFDMLDRHSLLPIHYKRVTEENEREVEYKDIVKGYEFSKGEYVVVTPKDFEDASPDKSQVIEISSFVNTEEIDSIYFNKPYYLEPGKNASKPYVLLREALRESNKSGVSQFVLRNREHLTILKPMDDILVLNFLRFKHEIRDPSQLVIPGDVKLSSAELDMALKLIDQLTDRFMPENYTDTYTDQLRELIAYKLEGKVPHKKLKQKEPTKMKDLMAVLKESLEMNKKKYA